MKKKKIISQICIHVILVALTAICLLPFLSMISTSFMKVKGVLPNEPILFPNFSTLSGKLCKSVDCKPFSDVLFQHTIRVCSGPYRKSVNFDHDGIFFLTIPVSRKGAYF